MENIEKEFTRMVSEHKDTIYMVCYMFSKDNAEVEDLYQEILINLWRSMPSFEGRSSVRTWIWRVDRRCDRPYCRAEEVLQSTARHRSGAGECQ